MASQRRVLRMWGFFILAWMLLASGTGWARYEINNGSNATLNFETLDPARGTWRSWSIYPNQTRDFQWQSGASGKVRIATQNRGFVEYDIYDGNRYKFIWDNNKGVWDMRATGKLANAAPPAAAQATPATQASWSLHNRTNETLRFQTLDPARGTWRDQSMFPNETKSYTFNPGVTQGKFRVATQNRGFVEYEMRAGWRYSIIWDKNKGVWDFRTVHKGT
ncbi:MAG: hypothetical protein ABL891_01365 [Burkholderiales bacterium]